MKTSISSLRLLALLGLTGLAGVPAALVVACGGGSNDAPGHASTDASGGGGHGDGSVESGAGDDDDIPGEAGVFLPPGFTDEDPAQAFDGGPYLVFYGQTTAPDGGAESSPGFHLYDEDTLAPAGDFTVAPVAAAVLGVTRDPSGSTWWTTAHIADGSLAAAAYDAHTGVLSFGPVLLAPSTETVVSPSFAVGIDGTLYIAGGAGGVAAAGRLFSVVTRPGGLDPIAVPAGFTSAAAVVNCLAYDTTVGLVAGTSSFVSGSSSPAPYVLVVPPGSTTATAAPATWSATFPAPISTGDGGTDAGGSFAGITSITVVPGGHLVYGLTSVGLAIVDLTASTGAIAALPSQLTPVVGAAPVVTADGAHVLFAVEAHDLSRQILVFDTATSTFTPIPDTAGYVFADELAIAGDGTRVFGVELANLPGTTSQVVRIDPSAKTLPQMAPFQQDERAALIPSFFAAQ